MSLWNEHTSRYIYTPPHTHMHSPCTHTPCTHHTHTHTQCLSPSSHHKTHLTSSKKKIVKSYLGKAAVLVWVWMSQKKPSFQDLVKLLTYKAVLCLWPPNLSVNKTPREKKGVGEISTSLLIQGRVLCVKQCTYTTPETHARYLA